MHSVPFQKIILYALWLLLPVWGFAQEKKQPSRKDWSYGQTEKIARIPLVQELMMDSINQRLNQLAILQPSLMAESKTDSNGNPIKNMAQLKESLQKFQMASFQQPFSVSGLSALYSLKNKVPALTRKPFQLTITEANSTTVYDNHTWSDQSFISQSSLGFTTSLFGLPFTYKVVNNYPAFIGQQMQPLFKVSFDQEHLLENVKTQLSTQFDVEKLLLKDLDFKNLFSQYGQKQLEALKQSALSKADLSQGLFSGLGQLQVEEFLYLTKEQLRQRVLNTGVLDSLVQEKSKYQALAATAFSGPEKDSLQSRISAIEESITGAQALMEKIMAAKETFETKGVDYNQLVRYQQQVNSGVAAITASPSFTQQASKKLLNLNSLTRLFMHIKELNVGQFSNNWSDRSISNVLTSGIGGSYLNKNKFLGLTIANTQPLGWLKDQSFTGSLSEPASRIQALRLGKGEVASNHNHFTFLNAVTKPASGILPSLPALQRNIAVGSFSKNLSLGKYGQLVAEVAKSNTQYQRSTNAAAELESKMALNHFGADFFQTLSLGLQYEHRFAKADFEPQVFINYAGLGYSNPAAAMQTRGTVYYGVQARKDFWGKKLNVQTRFSQRDSRVTVLDDRKMHQSQSSIIARYRISKKWRVGANWNYSGLSREEEHVNNTLFTSNRLNADAMFSGKLSGKPFYQYTAFGYQQMTTPGLYTGINGKTLWLNSAANWALAKGSLTTNIQFYNNLSAGNTQGDLFMADAGLNFTLLKKIQLHSAVTYLNQQHLAKQAGIRQTVTAFVQKRISINVFADVRHDLVENKNSFLYPTTRGEIQVNYQLN